jgi:hypothetical protein
MLTTQEPQRPAGRHPDDFYATPRWATVAMLDALPGHIGPWRNSPEYIIEPSCGDGAILDVLAERFPGELPSIVGFELNQQRAAEAERRGHFVLQGDYLAGSGGEHCSRTWVVGNPPFSLAQSFVEHTLSYLPNGARLTFLLRLAFLSSKRRRHLFATGAGFEWLFVLPRRPSFTPGGGTDQYDYGWFTWRKGFLGEARIRHIGAEPAVEPRPEKPANPDGVLPGQVALFGGGA